MKFRIIMPVRTVFSSRQWSRGRERNTTWAQEQTPSNLFTSARPYREKSSRPRLKSGAHRDCRAGRSAARSRRRPPLITRGYPERVVFDSLYSIARLEYPEPRVSTAPSHLPSVSRIVALITDRRPYARINRATRPFTTCSTHEFREPTNLSRIDSAILSTNSYARWNVVKFTQLREEASRRWRDYLALLIGAGISRKSRQRCKLSCFSYGAILLSRSSSSHREQCMRVRLTGRDVSM